jgi:hypothetical protein
MFSTQQDYDKTVIPAQGSHKADKRSIWKDDEVNASYLKYEDYRAYKKIVNEPELVPTTHHFYAMAEKMKNKDDSIEPQFCYRTP